MTRPSEVLAVAPLSVTKFDPSPTMNALSAGVNPATSVSCASKAWTSVPMTRPNDARAVDPLSVTKLDPSPTMNLPSAGVNPATSVSCASLGWYVLSSLNVPTLIVLLAILTNWPEPLCWSKLPDAALVIVTSLRPFKLVAPPPAVTAAST